MSMSLSTTRSSVSIGLFPITDMALRRKQLIQHVRIFSDEGLIVLVIKLFISIDLCFCTSSLILDVMQEIGSTFRRAPFCPHDSLDIYAM